MIDSCQFDHFSVGILLALWLNVAGFEDFTFRVARMCFEVGRPGGSGYVSEAE
jgi:hypothetical protein